MTNHKYNYTKELKKLLIDKGLTILDLAQRTGYTRVHISNVVRGISKSIRARKAICQVLNIQFEEIW